MEAEINIKSDNVIQLKQAKDVLRLKIKDENGNDTGNFLEFNLGDLDYLLVLQDMMEADKKNRANEFYKKEAEIYDMFLGKDGVKKLLNGRKLTPATLDEIDEIIEKAILPKLQIKAEDIKKDIMAKYSNKEKRDDVIE